MVKDIDILLVGSSIVNRWKNIQKKFCDKQIINLGGEGIKTNELLDESYFNKILNYNPKYIIYYCGGNDIQKNFVKEYIYNNIKLFYTKINMIYGSNVKIIFLSIIKSPKKRIEKKVDNINYINNKIKYLCKNNNSVYLNINKELKNINFYKKDMNHLKIIGYNKINEKLAKYIL
jgi:lysophospholipase L1-like esterase